MKVYYGEGTKDYLIEHMKMEEIEKLIMPKLNEKILEIGKEIKKKNCDN